MAQHEEKWEAVCFNYQGLDDLNKITTENPIQFMTSVSDGTKDSLHYPLFRVEWLLPTAKIDTFNKALEANDPKISPVSQNQLNLLSHLLEHILSEALGEKPDINTVETFVQTTWTLFNNSKKNRYNAHISYDRISITYIDDFHSREATDETYERFQRKVKQFIELFAHPERTLKHIDLELAAIDTENYEYSYNMKHAASRAVAIYRLINNEFGTGNHRLFDGRSTEEIVKLLVNLYNNIYEYSKLLIHTPFSLINKNPGKYQIFVKNIQQDYKNSPLRPMSDNLQTSEPIGLVGGNGVNEIRAFKIKPFTVRNDVDTSQIANTITMITDQDIKDSVWTKCQDLFTSNHIIINFIGKIKRYNVISFTCQDTANLDQIIYDVSIVAGGCKLVVIEDWQSDYPVASLSKFTQPLPTNSEIRQEIKKLKEEIEKLKQEIEQSIVNLSVKYDMQLLADNYRNYIKPREDSIKSSSISLYNLHAVQIQRAFDYECMYYRLPAYDKQKWTQFTSNPALVKFITDISKYIDDKNNANTIGKFPKALIMIPTNPAFKCLFDLIKSKLTTDQYTTSQLAYFLLSNLNEKANINAKVAFDKIVDATRDKIYELIGDRIAPYIQAKTASSNPELTCLALNTLSKKRRHVQQEPRIVALDSVKNIENYLIRPTTDPMFQGACPKSFCIDIILKDYPRLHINQQAIFDHFIHKVLNIYNDDMYHLFNSSFCYLTLSLRRQFGFYNLEQSQHKDGNDIKTRIIGLTTKEDVNIDLIKIFIIEYFWRFTFTKYPKDIRKTLSGDQVAALKNVEEYLHKLAPRVEVFRMDNFVDLTV